MTESEPNQALNILRRLVLVLTVTMILGMITITGLLVWRLIGRSPDLPAEITLPSGASVIAVTYGQGWVAAVGADNMLYVFDAATGQLRQSVLLDIGQR